MEKLIDRIDLSRAGVLYFREILREYGIDPVCINRHHLINVVALIIVAEMDSVNGDRILERLRKKHGTHPF